MRNLILYNRLKAIAGDVHVAKKGTDEETYRICCPFCGDTRYRLNISCLWGVYDPVEKHCNAHLIHCYNESCLKSSGVDAITADERRERRKDFLAQVYRGRNGAIILAPATRVRETDTGPLSWPGRVIRLDKLFAKRPEHPAVRYVLARGFDPVQLGEEYHFVFCDQVTDPRYTQALGTILIPIFYKGVMRTWLSRYIGEDKDIKRYYNCPNRPIQSWGFNLDIALQYSTVVVVEGVFDAIRVGPFATCLFTKTLGVELKKKIVRGLQRHGNKAAVVVMLDPGQSEKERLKSVPHHIETVAAAFKEYIPNVLTVYLTQGKDPGSLSPVAIMRHIQDAAKKSRINLNFET